jgi:hypothetical protein
LQPLPVSSSLRSRGRSDRTLADPHVAGKGKSGVLVALEAAFLIGGATFLVNFFKRPGRSPFMSPMAGLLVRRKRALGAHVLVILALMTVSVIANGHGSPTSAGRSAVEGSSPTFATTPSPPGPGSLTSEQQSELEQNIGRMRDVVPVNAATSPQYPAVSAEARQQPDLYAVAFVRQLLTLSVAMRAVAVSPTGLTARFADECSSSTSRVLSQVANNRFCIPRGRHVGS